MPIFLPNDIVFYVWVSYETPLGAEVFISDEPSHIAINQAFEVNPLSLGTERDIISGADMKFYAEEIRRRGLAMLENDGEEFFLYIRRMYGQPCVCRTREPQKQGRVIPMATGSYEDLGKDFDPAVASEPELNESRDPEYQANMRCSDCFGTGIAGGYYPKIKILMRYGNIPPRVLKFQEQGIEFRHDFNSWTIWHPRLKDHDVLVRVRNNDRFFVTEPAQSEWRGIPLHQQCNAKSAPDTDVVYDLSDDKIITALQTQSGWNLGKWVWAVYS
jgi:hypothetical protein